MRENLTPVVASLLSLQVQIRGSVLCRHGVMLLREENVVFLGGDVEALAETNAPEAVLEQRLYVVKSLGPVRFPIAVVRSSVFLPLSPLFQRKNLVESKTERLPLQTFTLDEIDLFSLGFVLRVISWRLVVRTRVVDFARAQKDEHGDE